MAVQNTPIARWGVASNGGAAGYGVVVSMETIKDALIQNETDEKGAVCRSVLYDERFRAMFCCQTAATTSPPALGASITVGGISGYVIHTEIVEQNTAFRKLRVTVEGYKNCTHVG